MADQSNTPATPKGSGNGGAGGAAGGGNQGGGGGSNKNRNRNRNRSRNRNRPAGGSSGSGGTRTAGAGGAKANQQKKGQGGGAQRSSQGGGGSGAPNRSRARPRSGQAQPRAAVALDPPPPLEPIDTEPSLGAPQIFPAEVAANRRRAILLCGWTAVVPALLFGALFWAAVSPLAGIVAFVAAGAAVMYGVWRLAPSMALRRIGAVPLDEQDQPRLSDVTEGLCATFGLSMPSLHVVEDDVPNACALGRDARRSDLVVTTGLLRRVDPIELEGVVAHELAHVKRGDNGVSCVGITLATLLGGETMLRRCVGQGREYRADVVGASAVRYPRGLLGALRTMMEAPAPAEGSLFASPSRFGRTRWVWIDPSVAHRDDPLVPGDLDATSVRAAALSEW
jgi:Zn-dependent protease with chaperone function